MSNVFNITRKIKAVATGKEIERRRHKRREVEKYMGSHLIDSNGREHRVIVRDISDNGMSLDLRPPESAFFKERGTVGFRVYLTDKNYIHIDVTVSSAKVVRSAGCQRIGVYFSATGRTDIIMFQLIRFIETLARIADTTEKKSKPA